MAIQGLRDTSNFVADARPKNWREGILLLEPNGSAPLFALTSLLGKRSTDDPEFNWWEKSMQTRRVQLASSATALDASGGTDTVTLVAGGNGLKIGDVLYVEHTEELLRVTVVTNDTTIDVLRSFGTVAATLVDTTLGATNPFCTVVGTVLPENSNAPVGVQFDPVKKFNFTEIFRHTLELSRTASKTRLRTGDQVKEAKRETLQIHTADVERAFFFGNRVETVVGGVPARMMGGCLEYIDAGNKVTAGATTDLQTLEGWLEQAFRFGSSEKVAFMGNRAMLVINQIVRRNTQFQITQGLKEFGMNVSRLVSPFGEIVMKTHPLFNQMTSSPGNYEAIDSNMIILDMSALKFVTFTGGDTKFQSKLEANDLDGLKSGYLSEVSLEVSHPTSHFQIKGLQAAAVDT